MTYQAVLQAILDYVTTVDELYGHYLDSTSGFVANERMILTGQAQAKHAVPHGVAQDSLPFVYGNGDPNNRSSKVLHETTQGAYKSRNAEGGQNHIRAGQLLVVLLFEYWESHHRQCIAVAMNLDDQKSLKVPLLGDLRALRQDVIHHRGLVRAETVRRLTVLTGLLAGDVLQLSKVAVEDTVLKLKGAMDDLAVSVGCPDPLHRQTWRA